MEGGAPQGLSFFRGAGRSEEALVLSHLCPVANPELWDDSGQDSPTQTPTLLSHCQLLGAHMLLNLA